MQALQAFLRRLDAGLTPAQRDRGDRRDALYAGIAVERWQQARRAALDPALVRDLHRAICGDQRRVRRADRDGRWVLADARPGLVRTKPQSFRLGDHVEPGWQPGEIKTGLARLLAAVGPALAADPVGRGAELLWAISHGQPFAGNNERLAVVVASWCLRGAHLPALPVVDVERDRGLHAALISATATDRSRLETWLATALWNEALVKVEGLEPPPPADPARWTLRDHHLALAEARQRVATLASDDVEGVADTAARMLASALGAELGIAIDGGERRWVTDHGQRLQVAWDSAVRGRALCPHQPVLMVRWPVGGLGLEASLIIAAAGRGLTGASSAHLALELPGQPVTAPAPALLLVPDEDRDQRRRRVEAWLPVAVRRAIERCPLRL